LALCHHLMERKMSNIPAARRLLLVVANHLDQRGDTNSAAWIREVVEGYMTRRSPRERAPAQSTPMTSELAESIRDYKSVNPSATQSDIAAAFRVNGGRVSEALNGFA